MDQRLSESDELSVWIDGRLYFTQKKKTQHKTSSQSNESSQNVQFPISICNKNSRLEIKFSWWKEKDDSASEYRWGSIKRLSQIHSILHCQMAMHNIFFIVFIPGNKKINGMSRVLERRSGEKMKNMCFSTIPSVQHNFRIDLLCKASWAGGKRRAREVDCSCAIVLSACNVNEIHEKELSENSTFPFSLLRFTEEYFHPWKMVERKKPFFTWIMAWALRV